jgi:hypothetical protein
MKKINKRFSAVERFSPTKWRRKRQSQAEPSITMIKAWKHGSNQYSQISALPCPRQPPCGSSPSGVVCS